MYSFSKTKPWAYSSYTLKLADGVQIWYLRYEAIDEVRCYYPLSLLVNDFRDSRYGSETKLFQLQQTIVFMAVISKPVYTHYEQLTIYNTYVVK